MDGHARTFLLTDTPHPFRQTHDFANGLGLLLYAVFAYLVDVVFPRLFDEFSDAAKQRSRPELSKLVNDDVARMLVVIVNVLADISQW